MTSKIKPCDDDVFKNGKSVCLVDISKEAAEDICRNISAATGCKVDWHYIGGRVHIKALPAPLSPDHSGGGAGVVLPDFAGLLREAYEAGDHNVFGTDLDDRIKSALDKVKELNK